MANAYERRKSERDREAGARRVAERDARGYNISRMADRYEVIHKECYGTADPLKYANGWFIDERGHRYRHADILKRTQAMLTQIDLRGTVAQIEHPEYLDGEDSNS